MKLKSLTAVAMLAVASLPLATEALAGNPEGIISDRRQGVVPDSSRCIPGQREICTFRGRYWQRHAHRHRHSVYIYFYSGYWWPWPYYGNPYVYNPYYDDDYGVANRMTCNHAKGILRNRGYHDIRATDCSGSHYRFIAYRSGHAYRITLNSYSGRYSKRVVY